MHNNALQKSNLIEQIAIDAEGSAALFASSIRTWRRWDAIGRCPRGFSLGKKRLWRLSDLKAWANMGFPRRNEFERLMAEKEQSNVA